MSAFLRGCSWMLASVFSFSGVGVGVRALADEGMASVEIVFFRVLFGVLIFIPWLFRGGTSVLKTKKLKWHTLRSVLMGVGMVFWFAAIARLPLADAIALHFTLPLFLVIYAWLLLGEKIESTRVVATIVGFFGVLIILRPGLNELSVANLFVLISAAMYAGNHALSRSFSGTESPELTTFLMNAMILVPTGIASLYWWTTPSFADCGWIVLIGICGTTSHLFLMKAYQYAEASALAPIDFLRIIFSGIAGYLIFGHVSDLWTWLGATVVFSAVWHNTITESNKKRDMSR